MEKISKIPQHVSIIMDGNGRWAREQGHERTYGHQNGVNSVRACVEAAAESGVKYLSLYAFSEENWNRPKEEVDFLMKLMAESISNEMEALMKNGVRFRVLGNMGRLHPMLRESISMLEEKTRDNTTVTLIVFLSYSGQWDIFQAAKRFASKFMSELDGKERLEQCNDASELSQFLVTDGIPDPDVIVRTSGEKRISNYLLWQGAYSEFVFVDKMWPEFGKEDFFNVLSEYASRDRRYGKVK